MKQNFSKLFLITALVGLLISSCRKEVNNPDAGQTNSPALNKVIDWLNVKEEAYKTSPAIRQTIASLKENLIGSQISAEVLNDKQNLIIVPLKNEFKTINNASQQSFKILVIIENDHKLMLSNIVEIIPKDQQLKKVPANLISNVFNNKDNDLNGNFSFFSLANTFMEDREYKGGKLISITHSNDLKKDGAGKGARVESEVEDEFIEVDEVYPENTIGLPNDEMELDNTGIYYVPIKYYYRAQIYREAETRVIESVVVDPITVESTFDTYVNQYGRVIDRNLTLYNHNNYYVIESPTVVQVTWNCLVFAMYHYRDTGMGWGRYWSKNNWAIFP